MAAKCNSCQHLKGITRCCHPTDPACLRHGFRSWEPIPLSPQAAKVLDILTSTSGLTQVMALSVYGIASITARIAELRRKGYGIETETFEDANSRRYAKYVLKRTPTELKETSEE